MPTSSRSRARNYVAMSPLLHKGGVHQRSKTGARADIKQEIQAEITDWQEDEFQSTTTLPQTESGETLLLSGSDQLNNKVHEMNPTSVGANSLTQYQ